MCYHLKIGQSFLLQRTSHPISLGKMNCSWCPKGSKLMAGNQFVDSASSNRGNIVPPELNPLLLAMNTVPVCSAECEKGFSQMNLIINRRRNSLSVETVSSLLFGKPVGPPFAKFIPLSWWHQQFGILNRHWLWCYIHCSVGQFVKILLCSQFLRSGCYTHCESCLDCFITE